MRPVSEREARRVRLGWDSVLRTSMAFTFLALFVYVAVHSRLEFSFNTWWFPFGVGVAGIVVGVAMVASELRRIVRIRRHAGEGSSVERRTRITDLSTELDEGESDGDGVRRVLVAQSPYFLWVFGYVYAIHLLGFWLATAGFMVAFQLVVARRRLTVTLLYSAIGLGGFYLLSSDLLPLLRLP